MENDIKLGLQDSKSTKLGKQNGAAELNEYTKTCFECKKKMRLGNKMVYRNYAYMLYNHHTCSLGHKI